MKTLLLPLDERPCNYIYPQMIASSNKEIQIIVPPKEILGDKKKPADLVEIERFLLRNTRETDNIILSIDMLIYGGLIPSRLHYLSKQDALSRLYLIKNIKLANPKIKIYAFNCIMRTPQYNSSDEEPDYYAEYGYALFRRKYLLDYKDRHGLNEQELSELGSIKIPNDIFYDYDTRREFNEFINIEVVNFLEAGYIDFLVIPQDDSSPYGYTAISQKNVIRHIEQKKLDMKVMIYPGADEVALSLLTRAYHDFKGIQLKIHAFYSSILGPSIVPLYEDRPMFESLKSHVRVCRAKLVMNPDEADFILAINSPGKIMQETYDKNIDITYTSCRNLLDFALQIKDYIEAEKPLALCDSAFCNGGDIQLIRYLDGLDILDKLKSYAGWNTNCNTLGTCLAQACLGEGINIFNLLYRIIEDVCYQAFVRHDIIESDIPLIEYIHDISVNDISNGLAVIEDLIRKKLQENYETLQIGKKYPVRIKKVYSPWKRMFEIGMDMELGRNERVGWY